MVQCPMKRDRCTRPTHGIRKQRNSNKDHNCCGSWRFSTGWCRSECRVADTSPKGRATLEPIWMQNQWHIPRRDDVGAYPNAESATYHHQQQQRLTLMPVWMQNQWRIPREGDIGAHLNAESFPGGVSSVLVQASSLACWRWCLSECWISDTSAEMVMLVPIWMQN